MAADGTQGPVVVGICVAFAVVTFCVLVLRLFARVYVLGKMGLDDCKCSVRHHYFHADSLQDLIIGACVRPSDSRSNKTFTNENSYWPGHLLLSQLLVS
jgi:hypothetical protein